MENNLDALRHSASHVMAQAVMRLYQNVKLAIGPSIEDGFYYDFDLEEKITEDELPRIMEEMCKIVSEKQQFTQDTISKEKASEFFKDQPYKIELISDISDEDVSLYKNGEFVDLCKGPHIENTDQLENFKLTRVAGAYWRGDEHNKMLTRIYGTVFPTQKELEEYLDRIEEAKKRDHRRLGKKLDLFSTHEDIGPGLIYWHPNGGIIRKVIEDFWRDEHLKNGYDILFTPHIARIDLWNTSGHTGFYRDYMFSTMQVDELEYQLKPMNCPFHIRIYKNSLKSYRDLPLRWCELGTVYRYEKSGVLHGLMRVRGFTQDDAHIFCRDDQLESELVKTIEFVMHVLGTFGFEKYEVYLSTRPDKYVGELEMWDKAQSALKNALEKTGLDYTIDPGEGVFYGPKIDIKIKDALNRTWQCSTIQVDFNLPERFDVNYIGSDGKEKRPIMIHRALMGSLERFFGVLIEHYGGRFPLWLAPVQLQIIPIGEDHFDFADDMAADMIMRGIRAKVNKKDEKLGKKIWQSRDMNIPYVVVIGDKEIESGKFSVRKLGGDDIKDLERQTLIDMLIAQISEKN